MSSAMDRVNAIRDRNRKPEKQEDEFGFGGAGSGADVFAKLHAPERHVVNHRDAAQRPAWVEDQAEQRQDERAERMATSAATGDWVRSGNEFAAQLYDEDGMDYNDMRKYASQAGIKDINSANDVQGIRDAYDAAHTSQAEMDSAFEAYGQSNETAAEPEKASVGMSYNDYLKDEEAKATSGIQPQGEGAAGAAQELVEQTKSKIKGSKGLMAKGKAKQGQYVLSNLGSDKFAGGN